MKTTPDHIEWSDKYGEVRFYEERPGKWRYVFSGGEAINLPSLKAAIADFRSGENLTICPRCNRPVKPTHYACELARRAGSTRSAKKARSSRRNGRLAGARKFATEMGYNGIIL